MVVKRLLIFLIIVSSILVLMPSSVAENSTDVKIITSLENTGFLTPALSENNTFVYNRFQFHLYSEENNTSYSIIVDNITIAERSIQNFKTIFYWNTSKTRINQLEIYIGNDSYFYSGIFIFSYSIENVTPVEEPGLIQFTKEELARYIAEVELKAVGKALVGGITSVYIFFRLVKKRKEGIVKRIL